MKTQQLEVEKDFSQVQAPCPQPGKQKSHFTAGALETHSG